MARRSSTYRAMAETGVCAALCVVLYVAGASLQGVGQYLKYICPGIIGIISLRHGRHQGAMLALVAALLIGLLVGFREFFIFTLLLTPIGLALPDLRFKGFRFKKIWYWLAYTICFSALAFILARLMGLTLPAFVRQMASIHYSLYGGIYEKVNISQDVFTRTVSAFLWILLPILALLYGTMLTLINRFVLAKGSALLGKK